MNNVQYIDIDAGAEGQRLDNYLIRILKGVPKSHVYRLIRSGQVRVNKKRADVSLKLQIGDSIRIPPVKTAADVTRTIPKSAMQPLLATIIYEDEAILAINKPAGIAVHGGSGISLGVIETLRQARPDIKHLELVHRLDKETSGCLLLAKKRSALRALHALLESKEVNKIYWALLAGKWQHPPHMHVDAALQKNILRSGERMVVVNEQGKPSWTDFILLENFANACLMEIRPKTGRTHQIRVHSAYLGTPVIGDQKYGKGDSRLYLHAYSIQFNLNDKIYNIQAELDKKFSTKIAELRLGGSLG